MNRWMAGKPLLAVAIALGAFAAFAGGAGPLLAQEPQHEKVENFEAPRTVAPLARQLSKAVVNISTTMKRNKPLVNPHGKPGGPFEEEFRKFFERRGGKRPPARKRKATALGSGFIIDPKGIIITNNHVVEGADEIIVNLADGTRLKATLRGRDPKTDLAVLTVKPEKPLPYVVFGNSDKTEVGDWVMAIGNPFGLGGSVTLGIVSARNRDIAAGPYDDFIQTDASINKGNSGGPLFNMKGEVVGVNSAILSPTGGSVGIGFSIPSNLARKVVDQLIKYGETRRGWLGVRIQTVTDELAEGLGLDKPGGALIAEVTKGGPADKAGLKPRDVIIAFNGVEVNKMRDLPRIVAETPVGAEVVVKILRDGKPMDIKVTLGRLEKADEIIRKARQAGKGEGEKAQTPVVLGMKLGPLDEKTRKEHKIPDKVKKGLVILSVEEGSDAESKGLSAGDVILEVGGKEVAGIEDVRKQIAVFRDKKRKAIPLLVLHRAAGYDARFIALWLDKKKR